METKYNVDDYDGILNEDTGQLLTKKEVDLEIDDGILRAYNEYAKEKFSVDGKLKFTLTKVKGSNYYLTNIKKDFEFIKLFKVEVRNIMDNELAVESLSVYAKATVASLTPYIHFPTNSVVKNSTNPSIPQLMKIIGISKGKVYEVLKELEYKQIIKRVKLHGQLVIYFNPYLYSTGLVDEEAYDMFRDTIYNPANRET